MQLFTFSCLVNSSEYNVACTLNLGHGRRSQLEITLLPMRGTLLSSNLRDVLNFIYSKLHLLEFLIIYKIYL